jgi:hypothetical protein
MDEGIGKAASRVYGGDAESYTNTIRGGRDEFQLNNPKTATGLQIGGAVAGILPALAFAPEATAAAASRSLLARVFGGAAIGAAGGATEGFVSGAGAGDGKVDRIDSAMDRAKLGTALGGVIGGALPVIGAGVRSVARPITNYFSTSRPLARTGLSRNAFDVINRAAEADEAIAGAGASNIARGGPGAMVADAGPSTRSLLDTALQKSGPSVASGRRRVEQRAAGAFNDITGALDNTLGPYQAVETSTRVIREGTRNARSTAYNAAYNTPIDYSSNNGRVLQSLLWRVPQDAINHANVLMRGEGLQSQQIMARVMPSGRIIYERLPDVRQLDYITRALGDWARQADGKGALGGMTDEGRVWSNLQRSIRNTAREAVPAYGTALDTAASAIDARNALQFGEQILTKMSRGEVAEGIRGASRAEITFMRSGVRAHIDDLIAKTKIAMTDTNMDARQAYAALRALSSPDARQKVSMLLGPDEARRLFDQLDQASTGIQLRANLAQNSKTMARQDMDETVRGMNEDGLGNAVRKGETLNVLKRAWQAITGGRKVDDQMREDQLYGEIVDFLTGPRGRDAQTRLATLRGIAAAGPEGERLAAQIAKAITLPSAAAGYSAGSSQ